MALKIAKCGTAAMRIGGLTFTATMSGLMNSRSRMPASKRSSARSVRRLSRFSSIWISG